MSETLETIDRIARLLREVLIEDHNSLVYETIRVEYDYEFMVFKVIFISNVAWHKYDISKEAAADDDEALKKTLNDLIEEFKAFDVSYRRGDR